MQRSTTPPPPLFIPVESRWSYRRRRAQMRQLDCLLLAVEEYNLDYGGGFEAPGELVARAMLLGCLTELTRLRRGRTSGAKLHADILSRQGELMVPVYTLHRGRLVRIVASDAGETFRDALLDSTELRKIA